MKRRKALKIVALAALAPKLEAWGAPGCPPGAAWTPGDYQLRFFTAEEYELLDRLAEMIIPADEHSPGAHAARVSLFADLMVGSSNEAIQKQWRAGLKRMQEETAQSSLSQALAKSALHEGRPATDLERFFAVLKGMTIEGYYTSAIGIHQDLQYQGNTYLSVFPGCTLESRVRGPKSGVRGQKVNG
jgi:hypothetical protein